MNNLLQDIRFAIRLFLKSPGLTLVAIITLALGIGLNTAIFSMVNFILLNPFPFPNSNRLVAAWEKPPDSDRNEVAPANFVDWSSQSTSFENMAAISFWSANLTGVDTPERLQGFQVSPSLFPMLAVTPYLGRSFLPDEATPGKDQIAVLSFELWQRRFGADPHIINSTISLNGIPHTVVGVMPRGFQVYRQADLWVPLAFTPEEKANREFHYLIVMGRLKPSVTIEQAQGEMSSIATNLQRIYPKTNTDQGIKLISLFDQTVVNIRPALVMLQAAVAFILLIACVNLANLMLARSTTRRKEIAIRLAMGASRRRLIRQLLTETTLLALLGGVAALVLAIWCVKLQIANTPPDILYVLPRLSQVGVDPLAFIFTLVVSVLVGILFGVAPAMQASRVDINETLKEGGRGEEGEQRRPLRSMLVVAEITVSVILLVIIGLVSRSFMRLMDVNPGFDRQNVLSMNLSLPKNKYPDPPAIASFYRRVLDGINAAPGVDSAAITSNLPLGGTSMAKTFTLEDHPISDPSQELLFNYRIVSPGYFKALGITLLKGRDLSRLDVAGASGVAVINERMMHKFWPDQDPLGRHIKLGGAESTKPWLSIVGVVSDIKSSSLDKGPTSEIYLPFEQAPIADMTLVVKTQTEPMSSAGTVRREIMSVDPDQPVYGVKSMQQVIADSVPTQRLSMTYLGIFGVVALLLVSIGIYGVMSYSVAQRRHEIGIKMALGAQPGDVLRGVVGQGMKLVGIGLGIGLVIAFVIDWLMTSGMLGFNLLFGLSAGDPVTFASVLAVLVAIGLAATYLPARRAMKVNPIATLREG
jgi:putative ABC transport system permease protein